MITETLIASLPSATDPLLAEQGLAPEVSIVMPCLNEAQTLGGCILKAQQFFSDSGIAGEVVVADNGSTDGSQEIATGLGARLVHVKEKGYGSALMGGINAARGKYVIMGDSDGQCDFTISMRYVAKLREGYDLVMGNRFEGEIEPGAMPWMHRYVGNPILSGIGRLFFRCRPRDFHAGFRAFSKEAVAKMDLRTTGMEFASEMVIKATLFGLRVTEVPTNLSRDGRNRPPHLRRWRDGWRHLRFMLLFSPRWLFFYPGVLLMLAGVAAGIWLELGPRAVGKVILDVHTLLYAGLAIIMGFQAVVFALFTKVFAISERLLPEDPRLNRLFHYIGLETGISSGALLLLAGLAGSVYAVSSFWGPHQFGELDLSKTFRIVIPSVTMLALGFQVIFSSFFLSVLGLRRK